MSDHDLKAEASAVSIGVRELCDFSARAGDLDLEANDLTKAMLVEVNAMLLERGLLMTQGTLVDATLIAVPSSTKNREHARDPEMHQTKKGNEWHFGMKAHIGVDRDSGLVHTVVSTAANGLTSDQLSPISVDGLSNVVQVSAGQAHVLAVKSSGSMWAWGENQGSQWGDSVGNRLRPGATLFTGDIAQVAVGGHSLAHATLLDSFDPTHMGRTNGIRALVISGNTRSWVTSIKGSKYARYVTL